MKRILGILVSVALLVSLIAGTAIQVQAAPPVQTMPPLHPVPLQTSPTGPVQLGLNIKVGPQDSTNDWIKAEGVVVVYLDGDTVKLQYRCVPGWVLFETHAAWSFDDLSDIPVTKSGNPIPGQFLLEMNTMMLLPELLLTS
jgi:hypothetical protein